MSTLHINTAADEQPAPAGHLHPNACLPLTGVVHLAWLAWNNHIGLHDNQDRLRYFDCTLMNGDLAHIGPFERGQGEMATAEWFYKNLPETPFIVDTSATVVAELQRPPGL